MELTTKLGGTPTKNEFEKVDTVQPDAIAKELMAQDGVQFGVVQCPASVSGGRVIDDIVINSILAALSRGILDRQLPKEGKTNAVVSVANAEFA